jgi:plastocyanin
MRRALLALVAILLATTLPTAAAPAAPAATKAKVKCHWVKATKKRKRHRVCVKVKAKTKTTKKATPKAGAPVAGATPTSSSAPSASPPVAAPAPAAVAPTPGPTPAPVVDPALTVPAAARLQATTREWSITLSRPTIAAGSAILQLVNRGEDPHDLHLRPTSGGADLLSIPVADPGAVADVNGTLPAGTYTLYCSLPGHEAAGMHATLTVQ